MEQEIQRAVKQYLSNYLWERTWFALFFPFVSVEYHTDERKPLMACLALMAWSQCSKCVWILSSNLGTYFLADQKPKLRDRSRTMDPLCSCWLPGKHHHLLWSWACLWSKYSPGTHVQPPPSNEGTVARMAGYHIPIAQMRIWKFRKNKSWMDNHPASE